MAEPTTFVHEQVAAWRERFEEAPATHVLEWAVEMFHPRLLLACSFGAEDVALVDMLVRIEPSARIFYLDTDLLFPETYAVRDRIITKYGIQPIQVKSFLTLEGQTQRFGPELWKRDPNQCCYLRKVQPLERLLSKEDAWITGIRREQAPTRANAGVVEWDGKFNLIKINPLARWTYKDVWRYIRRHHVPYNTLHDSGYPSIGCRPCTQPVKPGEDPRAGRWAGFNKTECGLHQ